MILNEAVRIIIITTIAFGAALLTTPFWAGVLKRAGFAKQIRTGEQTPVFNALHLRKAGTPTGGGVIIWTTVLGLAALFGILAALFDGMWDYLDFLNRAETYLPLAALAIAALLGLVDDWCGTVGLGGAPGGGLRVRHKAIIYAILAAIGAWWFYFRLEWDVLRVPFVGDFSIGLWYIPIFMFIVFASAFSANETDGLDGLLGGVALFAFVALTAVAFTLGRFDLAAFGGATIGALLAFLWHNIYPAKFFMGDTGSMSLGIVIGVVAMLTNTTLLLPFFTIILVIESLSVIIQLTSKKLRGRKVFKSTPIHHHFEALGWPESQITMRFWIISVVFVALGLALFFLSRVLG
jgi:phospho-N-acetylmuramoyl-pentapeptide-transferase